VLVAVIALVLGGGGAAWAKTRGSTATGSTTQFVAAKVATVTQTVAASGTIAAASEADLDFGAAGRVTAVLVATGDPVRKDQPLARIGRASLRADYDAAKAEREAAVDAVSQDSGDSSAERSADAAQVTAATTAVKEARQALAGATLRSTIAGTVTSVDLTRGEQVSSGSSSSDTSSAATTTRGAGASTATSTTSSTSSTGSQVVVQSAGTIVNGTVDDTDVQQVKPGQSVAITPDGATAPVSGVVRSVGSVPSSTSGVVAFPIVVRVSGHPSGVYAGAAATMTITTKHVSNVLEIPTLAVTYTGSTASVVVQQGGSTVKRTVTIGTTYGLESQVLSGVTAGEKVRVTIPSFGARTGRPGGGTGFGSGTGTGTGGTGTGTGGVGGGGGFSNGGGFGGSGGGG
jgi:multidrug efflux pump subunit AcrA (membrane-fusion protein)